MTNSNIQQMLSYLGKNLDLMALLYPKKSFTQQELARTIHMDVGNLSRKITKLSSEEIGLLSATRKKIDQKKAQRHIELSARGRLLYETINQIKNMSVQKEELDLSKIDLFLDVTENKNMPENTKENYIDILSNLFLSDPITLFHQHEGLKIVLEKGIKNPKNNYLYRRKISMIKDAIHILVLDKKAKQWLITKVYPNAAKSLDENKAPELTIWIIRLLKTLAIHIHILRNKISLQLWDKYFNLKLTLTTRMIDELKTAILEIYCKNTDGTRNLINNLKEKIESKNTIENDKAIKILDEIPYHIDLPRAVNHLNCRKTLD